MSSAYDRGQIHSLVMQMSGKIRLGGGMLCGFCLPIVIFLLCWHYPERTLTGDTVSFTRIIPPKIELRPAILTPGESVELSVRTWTERRLRRIVIRHPESGWSDVVLDADQHLPNSIVGELSIPGGYKSHDRSDSEIATVCLPESLFSNERIELVVDVSMVFPDIGRSAPGTFREEQAESSTAFEVSVSSAFRKWALWSIGFAVVAAMFPLGAQAIWLMTRICMGLQVPQRTLSGAFLVGAIFGSGLGLPLVVFTYLGWWQNYWDYF